MKAADIFFQDFQTKSNIIKCRLVVCPKVKFVNFIRDTNKEVIVEVKWINISFQNNVDK